MRLASLPGHLCTVAALALVVATAWQLVTGPIQPPADPEQMLALGEERLRGGDLNGATEWFSKAARAAPGRADVHLAAGRVHELAGSTEAAAEAYRTATRLEPTELAPALALAHVLADTGRRQEAESELDRARAANPDAIAPLLELASLRIEAGDRDGARDAFSELERRFPGDPRGALGLAGIAEADEDVGSARDAYLRATKVDSRSRAAWEGLGRVDAAASRFSDAERAYRRVVELDPDDASAIAVLATLVERQRRFDEALTLFRRSLGLLEDAGGSLRETRALAWTGVGTCLLARRETDAAYEALASALTDDPGQPEALWALVPIYLDREQWTAAADALRTVFPERGDDAAFWIAMGRAQAGQGQWVEARLAFERSLELDARSSEGRRWLGIALRATGAYRSAEVVLRDVVSRDPDDDLARLNLAIALGQLGEPDAAREHFSAARRLMPGRPEPLYHEAHLLLALGHGDDALRLAESAAELTPDDPAALEVLARALARHGDIARAREAVTAAIEHATRDDQRRYLEQLHERIAARELE
jgi:tetratricopeptide (TPR) repeat protein